MAIFKSTKEIFSPQYGTDVFDEKWMNYNHAFFPIQKQWDYSREMSIEDVDIWEVIYESGGFYGLYAAWSPYAEYYMILSGWNNVTKSINFETYYGKLANIKIIKKCKELKIPVSINKVWADPEDMWLYSN